MVVRLGSHTITVVRAAGKDRFGDYLAPSTETNVTGCYVQPRTSAEKTGLEDEVVSGLLAFIPATADIVATDRIRWNGDLYQVDGDPARWDDRRGHPHHLQVALKHVEG